MIKIGGGGKHGSAKMPELNRRPDESCLQPECGKEFFGAAARYNLDIHMEHIHPTVPWVASPRRQRKRKKSSGKLKAKGLYPLPEEQKVIALAILNITESITQTSELTGIPSDKLREWQKRDDAERRMRRGKERAFSSKAEAFVERMMQLMLIRSGQYTPEQMMKATALIAGLVPNLKIAPPKPAPAPHPVAQPAPEISAPKEDPPPTDERARYLELVESIMRDAESKGEPMSRDQVIDGLIAQRPEAEQYLRPTPQTVEPEESEAVN